MRSVQLELKADGVCQVTLHDPDSRNAMGLEMAVEFRGVIDRLLADPDRRVVILTGSGDAFSAGGNLQMLRAKSSKSAEVNRADMLAFYEAFLSVLQLDVPVVAAINGPAIGAGACLAMACDYRLASETAKIGFPFTRLGLHPGMGATCTLARIAGNAVAADLLLSGRIISAAEALSLGLVNQVVSPKRLMAATQAYVGELHHAAPGVLRTLLPTLRPDPEVLRRALEWEAQQQGLNYGTEEFLEGIEAALQRRPPRYEPPP